MLKAGLLLILTLIILGTYGNLLHYVMAYWITGLFVIGKMSIFICLVWGISRSMCPDILLGYSRLGKCQGNIIVCNYLSRAFNICGMFSESTNHGDYTFGYSLGAHLIIISFCNFTLISTVVCLIYIQWYWELILTRNGRFSRFISLATRQTTK